MLSKSPKPVLFMTHFQKAVLLLYATALADPPRVVADSPEHRIQYFRSDFGIAPATAGPLPQRFDAPETLRWRVATESGQSTPIVSGGKIFLTSYRHESKELAT